MNYTYIPDPIEIMDRQIDRELGKLNAQDEYPCAGCGEYGDPESMLPVSSHPASSLVCVDCVSSDDEGEAF